MKTGKKDGAINTLNDTAHTINFLIAGDIKAEDEWPVTKDNVEGLSQRMRDK